MNYCIVDKQKREGTFLRSLPRLQAVSALISKAQAATLESSLAKLEISWLWELAVGILGIILHGFAGMAAASTGGYF